MVEVVVTRNGQVTLSKEFRKELGIRIGDKVIMNRLKNTIIIAKKDPKAWDALGDFLPEDFSRVLEKIRQPTDKRFREVGIQ